VPGIDTHLRITPKTNGQYPVVCAELCGLGHSVMRQTAHVVDPPAFDDWLAKRSAGAAGGGGGGGGGGAPDGKTLFTDSGCGGCHKLADAGTSGGAGPDLDQGLKGKDPAFIKESIVNPDAEVAQGFGKGIMPPNYKSTLSAAEVDALVKFLSDATK
jgi:cytochrome c oxidase subunit 2